MDTILVLLSVVLWIIWLIGCFLPIIPWPIITYLWLIVLQLSSVSPFPISFLIIMWIISWWLIILDNFIPTLGAKKYWSSKRWERWTIIGTILWFFLWPLGILLGPFVWAFVWEMLLHKNEKNALRSARGTFIGIMYGTGIKLIVAWVMVRYIVSNAIQILF